jgi:hypothetical protein
MVSFLYLTFQVKYQRIILWTVTTNPFEALRYEWVYRYSRSQENTIEKFHL